MNKKLIRLTESELHRIIEESATNILTENDMEEGWLSNKFKQGKQALKTAFQDNDDMSIRDRWNNARRNWTNQGDLNKINDLIQQVSEFVDNGEIDPQITVAQLIGGKYNHGRFGRMTGKAANRRNQIARLGGTAY